MPGGAAAALERAIERTPSVTPAGPRLQDWETEQRRCRALPEQVSAVSAGYPRTRTAPCPRYPAGTRRTHCAAVLTARSITLQLPNGHTDAGLCCFLTA